LSADKACAGLVEQGRDALQLRLDSGELLLLLLEFGLAADEVDRHELRFVAAFLKISCERLKLSLNEFHTEEGGADVVRYDRHGDKDGDGDENAGEGGDHPAGVAWAKPEERDAAFAYTHSKDIPEVREDAAEEDQRENEPPVHVRPDLDLHAHSPRSSSAETSGRVFASTKLL